jgi:hypothetical protein
MGQNSDIDRKISQVQLSKKTWRRKSKKDLDKRQLAISKGYKFFEIYSNNAEEEKQKFKTQVLEELLKAKNLA